MTINTRQFNTFQINGDMASDGVETLMYIEKEIVLRSTGVGTIASIEKRIKTTAVGSLFTIEKRILNAASVNTFYTRNGWEPVVTIGGLTVTASELTGKITVTKTENQNHLAEFSIILVPNVYNLYNFQGKAVHISVRTAAGIKRIFTGIVDTPSINVIEEKLTLSCIADRRALMSELSGLEPYIGVYSDAVLGTSDDTYDRLSSRLTTIPYSFDFDSNNSYHLVSWTPKASADFSYGSGDVYRRNPTLSLESSANIINYINVKVEYGYQRCHHRQVSYVWQHTYSPTDYTNGTGNICPFLRDRPTLPTRELIRGAIGGVGWPVRGDIYFGQQFRSGSFNCYGSTVFWSTTETAYLNAPIVDGSGAPVNDASGNPLYRSVPTTISDNTELYTPYAAWIATTRFKQNIKETYNLVVRAPVSVSTYGTLAESVSYGKTSIYTFDEWEQYTAYQSAPSGTVTSPANPTSSYFFNADGDRAAFAQLISSALNKAKTQILASHRDTTIHFERALTPTMELYHTVSLTGKWMRGKGKCKMIRHVLNVGGNDGGVAGDAYTEVELAQFRASTTTAETALTPPSAITDAPDVQQPAIALDTHLGIDPSSPGSANWTGYVGNLAVVENLGGGSVNYTRTNYQESFIVSAPAIQDEFRGDKNLIASGTYNVNIPNDNIIYEAYG